MKIYQTAALALLLATTAAHAEIQCGKVRIGNGNHGRLFSMSESGVYREYPILKVDGNKTLAKTRYGTVTVSLTETPTVVWINTKGETAIDVCSYVNQQPKLPDYHATTPINRDPWAVLVNEVSNISAKQNNGTPNHIRFCEPAFKKCSDVIEYTNINGMRAVLQVHTTANGRVVDRLACELNKTGDVRTCINFDTKEQFTDMKDVNGDWTSITSEAESE